MNGAMNMIRRFLAGLFMALVASASWAQPMEWWETSNDAIYGTGVGTGSSWQEACSSWESAVIAFNASLGRTSSAMYLYNPNPQGTGGSCLIDNSAGGSTSLYVSKRSGCQANVPRDFTWFSHWSYDDGGGSPVNGTEVSNPDPYCDGSCVWSQDLDDIDGISCQGPEDASENGYFATYCTYPYKSTGATCTVQDPDPNAPEPTDPNPGTGDGGGDGDGDGGGDPGDGDGNGDDGDGPGGENPGDGAGGDGDGDNPGGGGPGGGTGPGSGDGDGEGEEEGGGECGIPGKPPCAVKIDETGTGTGAGAFDGVSSDGIGEALEGVKGSIQDVIDRDDTPNWTWTFQLPSGCTPLQLSGYNLSIDVCQWQGMIHDIMSMLWVAATFWFLVGMFTKAGD